MVYGSLYSGHVDRNPAQNKSQNRQFWSCRINVSNLLKKVPKSKDLMVLVNYNMDFLVDTLTNRINFRRSAKCQSFTPVIPFRPIRSLRFATLITLVIPVTPVMPLMPSSPVTLVSAQVKGRDSLDSFFQEI